MPDVSLRAFVSILGVASASCGLLGWWIQGTQAMAGFTGMAILSGWLVPLVIGGSLLNEFSGESARTETALQKWVWRLILVLGLGMLGFGNLTEFFNVVFEVLSTYWELALLAFAALPGMFIAWRGPRL